MSGRFCLLYDPFKLDSKPFSIRTHAVDTFSFNEEIYATKCYYYTGSHTIFIQRSPLNKSDVI